MRPYDRPLEAGESGVASVLGVEVPELRTLEDDILSDFAVDHPYGVGWWAPHPGSSRRILISDQLYSCVHSAGDILLEAGVHWLELLDQLESENHRLADVVKLVGGEPQMKLPPRATPYDEIGTELIRLHVIGVVRALAGALDCLAGVIIGVAGLPTSILRADFAGVRSTFAKQTKLAANEEGRAIQQQLGARLEVLISAAGPAGWLDWSLGFRNMLVHRGRRRDVGVMVLRPPVLVGPDGTPILRADFVLHLPRDPVRSEVEVLLDASNPAVLEEPAQATLGGLIGSTRRLLDAMAIELRAVWKWRRENANKIPQPKEQWPGGVNMNTQEFLGYRPGIAPFKPEQMTTSEADIRRLRASALDDAARHQWKQFD